MNNESQICFISSPHDSFFCGKVVEFKERYHKSPDEYHKALFYCLGINCDTRRNFENIYDWQTDCIKPECLKEGWQTSGSKKVVRMAFNLFCGGTPSVDENESVEKQLYECKQYFAVCMHHSSGKRSKFVTQSMFPMITSCTIC